MICSVNYDLKRPGQDYEALYQAIKSCGDWWHYLDSTWLVDTTLTAQGVWNNLEPHVDKNDFVLIVGVTRDYQGWLPQAAWDWINSRKIKMAA
ncbi:hypothetical protein G6L46_17375 [Agrobacterium rhizogenes]|nr:hypothetical protein [Rhizobium rhizogenes]